MRPKPHRHDRGFTLLEIIVTMTITAVLATMLYTYFGEAFLQSVAPVKRVQNSAALQRVMANIMADANVYPKWRSGTAYTNTNYVIPSNFNGFYYQCTSAGTSGTSEPTNWPVKSGGTVTDNTVTWTWAGKLRAVRSLEALKTAIGDEGSDQPAKEYGKNPDGVTYTAYRVDQNRFVNLDSGIEASGGNKFLKVTLRNESGQTLTALLVSD